MSRGQADYGQYAVKEVSAAVSDMGEVAARLGSIVTYDKRGDVVDFDNFEDAVLKWSVFESGGEVYPHSVDVKSGSQSVALSTEAGLGSYVELIKFIAVTASKRLGVELSFGGELVGRLDVFLLYRDGIHYYQSVVRLDMTNHLLYIYDGDLEDYILVADIGLLSYELGNHFFHTMKVVCDFVTGKYVRVLLGASEWDISTISIYRGFSADAQNFEIDIWKQNTEIGARITSIDDFVFTQAEP